MLVIGASFESLAWFWWDLVEDMLSFRVFMHTWLLWATLCQLGGNRVYRSQGHETGLESARPLNMVSRVLHQPHMQLSQLKF